LLLKLLPLSTKRFNKGSGFFEVGDIISPVYILDDGVIDGDTLSVSDTFDQLASISMDWNLKKRISEHG